MWFGKSNRVIDKIEKKGRNNWIRFHWRWIDGEWSRRFSELTKCIGSIVNIFIIAVRVYSSEWTKNAYILHTLATIYLFMFSINKILCCISASLSSFLCVRVCVYVCVMASVLYEHQTRKTHKATTTSFLYSLYPLSSSRFHNIARTVARVLRRFNRA